MTSHLLLITLGPIQDFIAQARRTRDLWYGSHLLSELGRCAARALVDGKGHLVFPALEAGDPELRRCRKPLREETKAPPLSIANKLLAEVPSGIDPEVLARDVREAVQAFWRDDIGANIKRKCDGLLAKGIDDTWREQLDSFLEFTASWAPLDDGHSSYSTARTKLEKAVAGRKNLRDFGQWTHLRGNVPKSSLDGARETVLRRANAREQSLTRRYRIDRNEQLDAIGLIKRAGGEPEQFVPIINVGLVPWLERAKSECPRQFEKLLKACEQLGLSQVRRSDLPCAALFPFNASIVLRSRWASVFDEEGLDENPDEWGRQHVGPLLKQLGEPSSYVVCLVADGDGMGHAIDSLKSASEHRELSRRLAKFASDARTIVEHEHMGSLVYAGGDDVLAFLPLSHALACADALRKNFAGHMQGPTLSVGIGVGHVMEAMGDLLDIGRAAERLAKGKDLPIEMRRNALGVIFDKRSGGQSTWRARWEQWNGDPTGRLLEDVQLLSHRLSSRKVYDIDRLLRSMPSPKNVGSDLRWHQVLEFEIRNALARNYGGDGGLTPDQVNLPLPMKYEDLHREASSWIARMKIARMLGDGNGQTSQYGLEVHS
ncbi:MAG: type III-B CRISPR-associated protein Cas10/Cmr2 [Bradymonadaceae bacterium]|nr:type III-B CRISPR-associated protein Cas10/Cmr2 [Lujinxingiaceae bacterium]